MDPAYLSPIVASFAAAPQVAARQAADRSSKAERGRPDGQIIVEHVDAVDAIGDHGDDARRRDERPKPPEEPSDDPLEHVDVVA